MDQSRPDASAGGRVLVVCTGNVCRSPYIERRLVQELRGTDVQVHSAGTGALVGEPMAVESAVRLARRGASDVGFLARQLDEQLLAGSDLVLAATREHVGVVVRSHIAALRRTFALADLADLLEGAAPEEVTAAPGSNQVARVVATAAARRSLVPPRRAEDAAIVDPIGRRPAVYDRMAGQVEELLPAVVRALRGRVPTSASG